MKKKVYMLIIALVLVVTMGSKVFAVQYPPSPDPVGGKTQTLPDEVCYEEHVYTYNDVKEILKIYRKKLQVTEYQMKIYDLDENGVINADDACLVYDLIEE